MLECEGKKEDADIQTRLKRSPFDLLFSGKASQSSHRRVDENGTCAQKSFKLKHRSPTTLLLLLITREPKNVKFRKSRLAASSSSVTASDEAKLKRPFY